MDVYILIVSIVIHLEFHSSDLKSIKYIDIYQVKS